jgi:hypothetical protein
MNPHSQPFVSTHNPWNIREPPINPNYFGNTIYYPQNFQRPTRAHSAPSRNESVVQIHPDPEYQEDRSVRNLYKVFPKNRNLKDISPEMAKYLINPEDTYVRWAIVVAPHWKIARSMDVVQDLPNFERPEDLVADKIAENVKITVPSILKVEEKIPAKDEFSCTDPDSGYCNPYLMNPDSHFGSVYQDGNGNYWSPNINIINFEDILLDEHGRRMLNDNVKICV